MTPQDRIAVALAYEKPAKASKHLKGEEDHARDVVQGDKACRSNGSLAAEQARQRLERKQRVGGGMFTAEQITRQRALLAKVKAAAGTDNIGRAAG